MKARYSIGNLNKQMEIPAINLYKILAIYQISQLNKMPYIIAEARIKVIIE